MTMGWLTRDSGRDIDRELAAVVAPAPLALYRTAYRQLPEFRFVDIFNAVEAVGRDRDPVTRIESENPEPLNALLHARRQAYNSRKLTQPSRLPWAVGVGREVLLPVDHFWVLTDDHGARLIVRLKYYAQAQVALLEVAASDLAAGEALMEAIVATSVAGSVYRNQTLQIAFEAGTRDEYGDVEKVEQLKVSFKGIDNVSDDDLVIDEEVRSILLRNVVDLHERRELLKGLGVPIRRGVLLYGPPGTGKTYACRYLCTKLPTATRIMVTGTALFKVGQIFQLARMLQPTVLFLEDVDLVFMSREVNLYSSVLGELLDHMDGLRPFEDIGFVLTTNAIDRMEEAVRDRPGRISQIIYFGPPNPELRRRYLRHYLDPYDTGEVDLEQLVADTEGATQAFLKEWVHRAAQMGSERLSDDPGELRLKTGDFEAALREMRAFAEGSTERIIGFQS